MPLSPAQARVFESSNSPFETGSKYTTDNLLDQVRTKLTLLFAIHDRDVFGK